MRTNLAHECQYCHEMDINSYLKNSRSNISQIKINFENIFIVAATQKPIETKMMRLLFKWVKHSKFQWRYHPKRVNLVLCTHLFGWCQRELCEVWMTSNHIVLPLKSKTKIVIQTTWILRIEKWTQIWVFDIIDLNSLKIVQLNEHWNTMNQSRAAVVCLWTFYVYYAQILYPDSTEAQPFPSY